MKNIIKSIASVALLFTAVFASEMASQAQNLPVGVYRDTNGVAFRKSAELQTDGSYIIDLEAFVTGDVHIEQKSVPADIVLVLDVSGSMDYHMYRTIDTTARARQAYSYNNYGNNTYYYKHTDGEYYPVSRGYYSTGFLNSTTHYYLTFSVNDTPYYLYNTGVRTTRPSDPSGGWFSNADEETIWTGELYEFETEDLGTRIANLKTAVGKFIDEIHHNDLYDSTGVRRKTADGQRDTVLGNQISIVKFASNAYYNSSAGYNSDQAPITVGNNTQNNGYNYTEVIQGFTGTDTQAKVTAMKNTVNALTAGGATAGDYGMNLARLLLKSIATTRTESSKTVVFFTDGSPTYGKQFNDDVATNTIANAYSVKSTYDAKVFTIGVFSGLSATEAENVDKYMNYTSSNYPNAQSMTEPRLPLFGAKYYQNASNANLDEIFKTVAQSSGGSGNTQVTSDAAVTVDVVSTSFTIPTNASQVEVLVAPCRGDTTYTAADGAEYAEYAGKTFLTFGEAKTPSAYGFTITPDIDQANNKVTTSGFDFSENWCGPDSDEPDGFRGYKQIIRFKIDVREDAVGGPNVYTNEKGSGIFVNNVNIAPFNRPTVKLPVSIWIKKEGLVGEDAAVFTLYRAPYKGPGIIPDDSSSGTSEYENFTKIMVSKETMDADGIVKITGLDPNFYYKIKEDAWAWSYDYQDYGAKYTVGEGVQNPFVFVNKPKEDIVKEAEAGFHNVFKKKVTVITE